jgi:hypothetical protein
LDAACYTFVGMRDKYVGEKMEQVFETKRDSWLVALSWASAFGMLFAAMALWRAPVPFAFRLLMGVLLVAMAAFVIWVLYGTRYTLTDSVLVARSGPFRWVIPLEEILEVFPTRNPLSSPACSLDRLCIRYRSRPSGIMISPKDAEGFLRELAARSPGLLRKGDRVLREKA